jgi:creatinine amidohydrolase
MLKQWSDMTSRDIAALRDPMVVILPVAATEQHGAHLPTGTDAYILAGILQAAALRKDDARAVALPLQAVGWSPEHANLPGTLSLDATLLAAGWIALGEVVAGAGLKRLLILNSHGGNPPPIQLAAMELRVRHGLFVVQAHWEGLCVPAEIAPRGAPSRDWHGGWIETSAMLHLRPELVDLAQACQSEARMPGQLAPDGPAPWAWMTTDIGTDGIIGNPRLASPSLGARLVERAVEGLAELLARMQQESWPPAQS